MQEQLTAAEVKRIQAGEHVPRRPGPRPDITSLVVTIPMPPAAASPNVRSHWAAKCKAVKAQRNDARLAAKDAMRDLCSPPMWERATIQATWHKPRGRVRADSDNLTTCLKGTCDGLQDAGIIANDSGLTWLPHEQLLGKDAAEAKVVLTIRRVQ